jgi:hypothetical protein
MPIDISRKDLYERVWSEPIQKLSKEFGLSDVGLAKVCRRYNIPISPRGYWAKKQAGKRVSMPTLPPEAPKGYGDQVRVPGPSSTRPVEPASVPPPPHPLIAAEADPSNAISVPEDLRIRHALLRSTREYWRMVGRPNFNWSVPLPPHFNINVGRATQVRALRLLQALFDTLDRRGHQVGVGDRRQIRVTVLKENCDVFVRERQRQVRRNPTAETSKSSTFHYSRPYDLEHTGELEFRIERRFGRHTVRDGKGRPLEQQLNHVVVCLLEAALAEKNYRAEQERARLAEAERARRQAIAKQRAREERARTKRLEQLVAAVNHHKQLVTFAAELRDAIGVVEPRSELGRWLEWVDQYVEDADVLERFRNRQPTLTLYHCASTYAAEGIVKNGFDGRGPEPGEDQELPASVVLTDVPMEGVYGGTVCVLIDVPEETALPYESLQGNKTYRRFRMPAEIINSFERRLDSD